MKNNNANERSDEPKSKNAKPNRSTRRKMSKDKDSKFYPKTKGSNDLAWHTPDAELLRRSATIPWSFQTGEMIHTGHQLGYTGLDSPNTYASQAGFMLIREQMSVGGAGFINPNDMNWYSNQPSYNAANSLLTTMRSRTRVRNTYDAPDVLMLMVAMDNIYGTVAWFKRLAATVKMFSYQNHYMPRDMLRAQGVDPDWFQANQYQFVTELNVIISEINKVYIPARMHLFELHNQRFSNYYTEGQSIKDQIYMFAPGFLNIIDYDYNSDYASVVRPLLCVPGDWVLNDAGSEIVGTKYHADNVITGDILLLALKQMVRAVIEHDSTADITGDMENAFGTNERFILSSCDPDAIAAPIFDEEILETIHNLSTSFVVAQSYQAFDNTASGYNKLDFCTVQQVTTNKIGTFDCFEMAPTDNNKNRIIAESSLDLLDVHADPTPEKTFAITRLRNVVANVNKYSSDMWYVQIEFSADLILQMNVVDYHINSGSRVYVRHGFDSVMTLQAAVIAALAPFHYRPLLKIVQNSNYAVQDHIWYLGETDIFATIPDLKTIQNMNRISLLTLLGAYNNL